MARWTLLLLATVGAPVVAAAGPRLLHVPPGSAMAGQPLVIEAHLEETRGEAPVLHFRTAGDAGWRMVPFALRAEGGVQAEIPASALRSPGIEYYIEGHFASEEAPFFVRVDEPPDERRLQKELSRLGHRRARLRVAGEWVDFGQRTFMTQDGPRTIADRYYRVDADFTYRLLSFPLYWLRFGATQLLGETPASAARGDDGSCQALSAADCSVDAGFRVGPWFELRFRLGESVDLDGRAMVMATPEGFNFGSRGELRFGPEHGSHVALGGEGLVDVGASVYARLAWDTVPGVPMAATVEVTNLPAAHRDFGVRVVYDAHIAMESGLRLGGRVGYQARDEGVGGVTLGLLVSHDFWLFQ